MLKYIHTLSKGHIPVVDTLSNEKVNCKQHDKAGRRVSGPAGDLAFQDVSISPLARSVQLSVPLSVAKDTRPIRGYRI